MEAPLPPFQRPSLYLLGISARPRCGGGSMISGHKHGQIAAGMALKILDGAPVDSLPVVREPTGSYLFDYLVMRRLNIPETLLPEGSTLINAPRPSTNFPRNCSGPSSPACCCCWSP